MSARGASVGLTGVLAALALGGCGLGGATRPARSAQRPGAATSSSPAAGALAAGAPAARAPAAGGLAAASPAARVQRTHEVPTPAGRQAVVGGWRTPTEAVEGFASAYVNWSASTVAARLRELAQVSVGQARAAMTVAAAEVAGDTELARGGIVNTGTIEAIGPLAGRAREYAVVTRERTTALRDDAYRGLAPAWHVSVASVARIANGLWVLSGWQPEN